MFDGTRPNPELPAHDADLRWLRDEESRPEPPPPNPGDLGEPIDFEKIFAELFDQRRTDRPAVANAQDSMDQNPFFDQTPAMAEPPTPPPESEEAPIAKIEAAPEFPGAPYADEMFGNLYLGPDYPALKAKFEDPNLPTLEKQRVAWQIASLHVQAAENNAWWDGPLNTRRDVAPTPSEIPEPEKPPFVDDSPNNSDLDVDLDDLPKIDESELLDKKPGTEDPTVLVMNPPPAEEPSTAESGNWFQRKWRKLRRGVEDFAEYTNRHRLESKVLAFIGGFAGMGSAITGAVAAEYALAAGAGIVAGPIGIATGLAVNYFGFSKLMQIWADSQARQELERGNSHTNLSEREYLDKIDLDRRGRIKAFAIADVLGKIVSGTYLGSLLSHHSAEPSRVAEPGQVDGSQTPQQGTLGHQDSINHGSLGSERLPHPEITPIHTVSHIVTDKDTWEGILYQHQLDPYSPDTIQVLELNRDRLIQMWSNWAAHNPHHSIPTHMGADSHIEYLSAKQMSQILDRVLHNGYPSAELAKLDYAEYARQLADIERVNHWVLPGTEFIIPEP